MPQKRRNKPPKIPVHVERILRLMQEGRVLCKGYRPKVIGVTERVECYWLEPGGRGVGAVSARRAIKAGHVKPLGLALLDDGNHQTWGLA